MIKSFHVPPCDRYLSPMPRSFCSPPSPLPYPQMRILSPPIRPWDRDRQSREKRKESNTQKKHRAAVWCFLPNDTPLRRRKREEKTGVQLQEVSAMKKTETKKKETKKKEKEKVYGWGKRRNPPVSIGRAVDGVCIMGGCMACAYAAAASSCFHISCLRVFVQHSALLARSSCSWP